MRPYGPFCLAFGLAALLSACAEPPAEERMAAWTTTTKIDIQPAAIAPAPSPMRRIRTASLAPIAAPIQKESLSGNHSLMGIASFYWQDQKTANGEQFDKMGMTAAHKTLPFGTRVKVTNLRNGRTVVVRINDRGPFKPDRVIDLSYAAAGEIEMRDRGLAPVRIEVMN